MRKWERERKTQAEGEAGSMQGARCGTRFWVSRIIPQAEGDAKPLGHWGYPVLNIFKGSSVFSLLLSSQICSSHQTKDGSSGESLFCWHVFLPFWNLVDLAFFLSLILWRLKEISDHGFGLTWLGLVTLGRMGCHNKIPQIGGVNTAMHYVSILGARSSRWRYWQVQFLLRFVSLLCRWPPSRCPHMLFPLSVS